MCYLNLDIGKMDSRNDFDELCLLLNESTLQNDEIEMTNIEIQTQFTLIFMTKVLISNQEIKVKQEIVVEFI